MHNHAISVASLSTFLPPETIDMLRKHTADLPQDFAFEQEMTILFTDMRGFTALSEQYEPHEVYQTINASLALQTKIIHRFGGSINKFLGDGVLACFSGDDRINRAFDCVQHLVASLKALDKDARYLPCEVGFGLNDGKVLFGLLGDQERREFTVIGDTVNTAARLCGIARPFQALMTEFFVQQLPHTSKERYAFLEKAFFKGKRDAIRIYTICT